MVNTSLIIQQSTSDTESIFGTDFTNHWSEVNRYLGLISVVSLFTVILMYLRSTAFDQYFGELHPLLGIAIVDILGFIILSVFYRDQRFEIYSVRCPQGLLLALVLAPLFCIGTIGIDLFFRYPEDINVILPQSLLFYPAIGFVVEIIFHLLPLFLLWLVIRRFAPTELQDRLLAASMVIIALLEPVFQISLGNSVGFPMWIVIGFSILLFVFNLVQFQLLRKYDFLSMFSFRMVYYCCWHILWGTARLELLF
jgi:hypothetical protein